jgi:manganese/iron transport system substrate-binding protein
MMHQWVPNSARVLGVAAVSLTVGLMGCGPSETVETSEAPIEETADLPQVVATTSVLCDLTQQVAADTIALTCLMEPGQDPHTYQARPSDRQAIDDADLVLYDGYNFAPSVLGLVEASTNTAPKVAVFEAAVPDPLMGKGHDHDHDHAEGEAHDHDHAEGEAHDHDHAEGEAHDHAEGEAHDHDHAEGETHDHGETADLVPDPHIWHSASNNAAMVEVIATNLAQVNPDQADFYQDNAAQLSAQFTELDGWIQTQVDTIPVNNRRLVTTHDAFRYFADAYDFEVKGALSGLSTEEKPSAAALTALVDQVKGATVPAIFAETTTNPDLINAVASNAAVKVAEQPLFVEGPGGPGSAADTTQEMLVANTCTIVNALGGTCNESDAPI